MEETDEVEALARDIEATTPEVVAPYGFKPDGTPFKRKPRPSIRGANYEENLKKEKTRRKINPRTASRGLVFHEMMRRCKYRYLTPARIISVWEKIYQIAMNDERGVEQVRAAEFLIEQANGKASSKIAVETSSEQNITIEQRIVMAQVHAGLMHKITNAKAALPPPETVEGEVVNESERGGHSEVDQRHSGEVPAVPAAVSGGPVAKDHL